MKVRKKKNIHSIQKEKDHGGRVTQEPYRKKTPLFPPLGEERKRGEKQR